MLPRQLSAASFPVTPKNKAVAVVAMNIYMIHVVSSSEISIERYGQDAAILHTPFLTNLHHVNVHFFYCGHGYMDLDVGTILFNYSRWKFGEKVYCC